MSRIWGPLVRQSVWPATLGALVYAGTQWLLYRLEVGWFLNTGQSVAVVAGVMALTAAAFVWQDRRELAPEVLATLALAAGASVAMTVSGALAGDSNIFPIVVAIGSLILFASAILGGLAGYGVRPRRAV